MKTKTYYLPFRLRMGLSWTYSSREKLCSLQFTILLRIQSSPAWWITSRSGITLLLMQRREGRASQKNLSQSTRSRHHAPQQWMKRVLAIKILCEESNRTSWMPRRITCMQTVVCRTRCNNPQSRLSLALLATTTTLCNTINNIQAYRLGWQTD